MVTLTHLPKQWAAELSRFAPDLKVHILKSGKPYDLIAADKPKKGTALLDGDAERMPDVVISNYHKLHGWADQLAGVVRYVVFDEVQELRHADTNKYAAAKLIASKAELRIGLSATPIYNYGAEFFNVIDALRPDSLGTRSEFLREWCPTGERITDPQAFGEHLRHEGIMIRRTREEVGRELPPISRIPHVIDCDRGALDRIQGSAVGLAKIILAANERYRGEKMRAAEEFNVLVRQATGVFPAGIVQCLSSGAAKVRRTCRRRCGASGNWAWSTSAATLASPMVSTIPPPFWR